MAMIQTVDNPGFQIVAPKAPRELALMSMTELAEHILLRQTREPGWGFLANCRLDSPTKQVARRRVLKQLAPVFRFIKVFTMPSAYWEFERQLLAWRGSRSTLISSVEIDEAIYRVALNFIPASDSLRHERLAHGASTVMQTDEVGRFYRVSFEDYAETEPLNERDKYNAAWLDFNGPLTINRARSVVTFLNKHCYENCRLILTVLNGHYDADTFAVLSEYEDRFDGLEALLRREGMGKGRRIETYAYQQEGTPMLQIGWSFFEEVR